MKASATSSRISRLVRRRPARLQCPCSQVFLAREEDYFLPHDTTIRYRPFATVISKRSNSIRSFSRRSHDPVPNHLSPPQSNNKNNNPNTLPWRRSLSNLTGSTTELSTSKEEAIDAHKKLLNIPLGSMAVQQVKEAVLLVKVLTESDNSKMDHSDLDASFALWERLLREAGWIHNTGSNQGQTSTTNNSAYHDFFHIQRGCCWTHIIPSWEIMYRKSREKSWAYTPDRVFALVERTRDVFRHPVGIKVYNAILRAYQTQFERTSSTTSKAPVLDQAKQLQKILDTMLQSTTKHNTATTFAYQMVIEAWLKAGTVQKAMQIMRAILKESQTPDDHTSTKNKLRFGSTMFEQALQVCTVSKNGGNLANQVMTVMQDFYKCNLLSQAPNVMHYTQVVNAWAKSKQPMAGERATEIFEYVKDQQELQLDATTYSALFEAWARIGDMEKAENLLLQMCADYRKGTIQIKPDVQCFGSVLDGWAQAKYCHDAGERAERLLQFMWNWHDEKQEIVPDVGCYNSVMHAYVMSKHPTAGDECERLYHELLDKQEDMSLPNLEPNTKTYGTLLNAWAQSGEADRAAAILGVICQQYQDTEDTSAAEPDVNCFNIVLNAFAQSRTENAGQEASRLLQKMWELDSTFSNIRPNAVSYNCAINAWSKSGHSNAGEEAEILLREMSDRYRQSGNDPGLKPGDIAYNSVLNAYAKCGDYHGAKAIFSSMLASKESDNRDDSVPVRTLNTYNSLLDALSRSDENEISQKADTLLLAMGIRGVKPDVVTFKMVHKCWFRDHPNHKTTHRLDVLRQKIEELEHAIEDTTIN